MALKRRAAGTLPTSPSAAPPPSSAAFPKVLLWVEEEEALDPSLDIVPLLFLFAEFVYLLYSRKAHLWVYIVSLTQC